MNYGLSRVGTHCRQKSKIILDFSRALNFSTGSTRNADESSETKPKKLKEILRVPESELEGYAIGVKKPPLTDRRGETQSVYRQLIDNDSISNKVEFLSWAHADIDVRPSTIKRWWSTVEAEYEITTQSFNEKRNAVLGGDLSAAHFILARKGKIRFKGHKDWISTYRRDIVTGKEDEDDLPAMSFDLCTVPTKYDPRFRLEAIDAANMTIIYEGLANLENLDYVKWLSFRGCPLIDDWCLDKVFRMFSHKLEYLDISGCANVTGRSIGAARRCSKLETLVVSDMEHVEDLAIICAQLEDEVAGLTVVGVDYQTKLLQLRQQNEEAKLKELTAAVELEANTITVESQDEPKRQEELTSKQSKNV